jgi:dTDP-4-dehydrorhamnose 3,5-epimerase
MTELARQGAIAGVIVRPLRQIPDERGKVMHMLRADSDGYVAFGEIYFSSVYPGAIKAWHLHKRMTLNLAVPLGRIKFVLYDDREGSATRGVVQEIFLGEANYALAIVPPLVWHGFKGIGTETALVANCASIPHDPTEIERKSPFDTAIPYSWDLRHG